MARPCRICRGQNAVCNYITKVIVFYKILLLFSVSCCAFIYYALPVNSRLKNSQKMISLSAFVRFRTILTISPKNNRTQFFTK